MFYNRNPAVYSPEAKPHALAAVSIRQRYGVSPHMAACIAELAGFDPEGRK